MDSAMEKDIENALNASWIDLHVLVENNPNDTLSIERRRRMDLLMRAKHIVRTMARIQNEIKQV